jgi:hypothetical protein
MFEYKYELNNFYYFSERIGKKSDTIRSVNTPETSSERVP